MNGGVSNLKTCQVWYIADTANGFRQFQGEIMQVWNKNMRYALLVLILRKKR